MQTNKKGSELVEVRLTNDEQNTLIRVFVDSTMSDVSREHFEAVLVETDGDFKEALYQTALNEIINMVIEQEVEQQKAITQAAEDVKADLISRKYTLDEAIANPSVMNDHPFWPVL